mmetsp:Transcript_54678/g.129198  ORF Transcript_54678/g.129198 Transcript_54678/m.129198 type:complete len:288 (+) Transcript_54678:2475-3338(+)
MGGWRRRWRPGGGASGKAGRLAHNAGFQGFRTHCHAPLHPSRLHPDRRRIRRAGAGQCQGRRPLGACHRCAAEGHRRVHAADGQQGGQGGGGQLAGGGDGGDPRDEDGGRRDEDARRRRAGPARRPAGGIEARQLPRDADGPATPHPGRRDGAADADRRGRGQAAQQRRDQGPGASQIAAASAQARPALAAIAAISCASRGHSGSGRSWPQPGMISSRAPGMRRARSWAAGTGISASSAPCSTSVGALMRGSRSARCVSAAMATSWRATACGRNDRFTPRAMRSRSA